MNPSLATRRLVTTETGDPIINDQRILLERLSDHQMEYCPVNEEAIASFNLMILTDDEVANSCSELNNTRPEMDTRTNPIINSLVEANYEKFNIGLKKNVWLKIANTKWKGLKRTYKNIKDHNNKSSNGRKKWEFFMAIDRFLSQKPEISPESVCGTSSNQLQLKACDPDTSSNSNKVVPGPGRKKRRCGIDERHQEKMKKFGEFLKLFKLSVEHQTGQNIRD